MSDMSATLRVEDGAFEVSAREQIDYTIRICEGVFDPSNEHLAELYRPYGRCLMVVDETVHELYSAAIHDYFVTHGIALTTVPLTIRETDKSLRTVEHIVDQLGAFGINRKEPVLVVGGGLTTDVAGFACAAFRRSTDYIRIPTTLIGLIDASVSIKVAVNHGKNKNRLGAFHASREVLLDFSFLATLPEAQVRNGMAELIKISVVDDAAIFDLLDEHGEELLTTRFGYLDGSPEVRQAARTITHDAILRMLELETPNLHEIDLDRVIAFGHTWSPTLELAPQVPFFHGHAITVDMALSTTVAARRGYLTEADRDRVHGLMSRLGLTLDTPHLTPEVLEKGTESILQTRDGLLRAAVPRPIGQCHFINDLSTEELLAGLEEHRALAAGYPGGGAGTDQFIAAATPA